MLYCRLIRQSRNGLGYRCTPDGLAVLQGAEIGYPQDKSYRSSGDTLTRRFQTAEITGFFWCYGADVFTEVPPAETEGSVFLPSFALRRKQHANILGGTKLSGFYYTDDTVFIPYYIAPENRGLYPDVEQRTFRADTLLRGRSPHILYTGAGELQEIIRTIEHRREQSPKVTTVAYKDAMGQFNCPVAIVPMDEEGMRQLRILSVPDYRQRLLKNILRESYSPPLSPEYDGRTEHENHIIGFDCNILRFETAVRSQKPTSIYVLPHQSKIVQSMVADTNAACYVIEFDAVEDYLGLPSELNVFQNKLVDDITKHHEIDLTLPGKQKCAYFCIISYQDSSLEFLSSIHTAIFAGLAGTLYDPICHGISEFLVFGVNRILDIAQVLQGVKAVQGGHTSFNTQNAFKANDAALPHSGLHSIVMAAVEANPFAERRAGSQLHPGTHNALAIGNYSPGQLDPLILAQTLHMHFLLPQIIKNR